jgi:tetratricopeptide (TPR) repeat protein
LRTDPGNQQLLSRAGDCSARLGQSTRAEAFYTSCLALGYHRPALLGLGQLRRGQGDLPVAAACFERILARNPADPRTISLQSDTLREWRGPQAALCFLESMLAAHPGLAELRGALIRLQAQARCEQPARQPGPSRPT